MKGFLVAACFAAVLVALEAKKDTYTKIAEKCKEIHNVSQEELDKMKEKDTIIEYSDSGKCFIACILKEAHIVTDGKFSKDNALIMSDVLHKDNAEDAEKSRDVVDHCLKEVPDKDITSPKEECEHGYNIVHCWALEAKKRGIHSTDNII